MKKMKWQLDNWAVNDFFADYHLFLDGRTVELSLTFSHFDGYDCRAVDGFGAVVDMEEVAEELGYDGTFDLFSDLTDGLFDWSAAEREGEVPA